jgi:hypothetical protein
MVVLSLAKTQATVPVPVLTLAPWTAWQLFDVLRCKEPRQVQLRFSRRHKESVNASLEKLILKLMAKSFFLNCQNCQTKLHFLLLLS